MESWVAKRFFFLFLFGIISLRYANVRLRFGCKWHRYFTEVETKFVLWCTILKGLRTDASSILVDLPSCDSQSNYDSLHDRSDMWRFHGESSLRTGATAVTISVRTQTYPVVFKTIYKRLASLREIRWAQEVDRVNIYINSRQKPVSDLLQKQDTR